MGTFDSPVWLLIMAGTLVGACGGLGLVLVTLYNPWTRPRSVESRIDPYVRRGTRKSEFARLEWGWLEHPFARTVIRPPLERLVATSGRVLGSRSDVERRLALAGSETTFRSYRIQQVIYAVVGFLSSAVLSTAVLLKTQVSLIVLVGLVLISTFAAVLARDYQLSSRVKARARRLAREFPTVADLLALAVAAGEGPVAAMERVARISHGDLARELGLVVAEVRAGTTVDEALIAMGTRSPLPSIGRFAETIAVALERGTPLADVLRAQAQDAREIAKRELMESAGKREIYMLVPVIFFLMPLVIVFAIFPGLTVLEVAF